MPPKKVKGTIVEYTLYPAEKRDEWDVTLIFKYDEPLINSSGKDAFTHVYHEYKTNGKKHFPDYHRRLNDILLKRVSITVDNKTNTIISWKSLIVK